jgi:hypothetical protein
MLLQWIFFEQKLVCFILSSYFPRVIFAQGQYAGCVKDLIDQIEKLKTELLMEKIRNENNEKIHNLELEKKNVELEKKNIELEKKDVELEKKNIELENKDLKIQIMKLTKLTKK